MQCPFLHRLRVDLADGEAIEMAANLVLNTMIMPVMLGARKLAHTVIPIRYAALILETLEQCISDPAVMHCGLIFSGSERDYVDIYVADNQDTMRALDRAIEVFLSRCARIDAEFSMPAHEAIARTAAAKAQREIGMLFGYTDIPEEGEPIGWTPPHYTWLAPEMDKAELFMISRTFPYTHESLEKLAAHLHNYKLNADT